MSRYSVRMSAHVHRDVEIEAESPEEAVKLVTLRAVEPASGQHVQVLDGLVVSGPAAFRLRPERVDEIERGELVASNGTTIDDFAVDGWEVLGACEACNAPLLEDRDEGVPFGEDVTLCVPCAAKAAAEIDAEATQVIDPPGLLLDELDGTGPEEPLFVTAARDDRALEERHKRRVEAAAAQAAQDGLTLKSPVPTKVGPGSVCEIEGCEAEAVAFNLLAPKPYGVRCEAHTPDDETADDVLGDGQ